MASITWQTGFPTDGNNAITGKCNYTLGAGEAFQMAELIANKGASEYQTNMPPADGKCEGTITGLPTGTYDVTGKLYYNTTGGKGIVNTTVERVTV